MSSDTRTPHRLLARMEQSVRETNCSIIDPMIPAIRPDSLQPIIASTARARGTYLKAFLEVASTTEEGMPTAEQLDKLRALRHAYKEMTAGYQALEAAIDRGYLTVEEDE